MTRAFFLCRFLVTLGGSPIVVVTNAAGGGLSHCAAQKLFENCVRGFVSYVRKTCVAGTGDVGRAITPAGG